MDDRQLSSVLSEFASTLATDFPISSILEHLVKRIVMILPITSAGVTLIEPGFDPRYVAASDAEALRFERLQTDLGQGPCVLAYESGQAVAIPSLIDETRFPEFVPAALDAGMGAVFAFPMHQGHRRLGALDLYRVTPGDLDPVELDAAQTLANVAAAYVLNARAREEAHLSSSRMRHLATHDELTGLPNRMLLLERIEFASQRTRRTHSPAAVLFVDLDRFKAVNDAYGHPAGDELLRAVADRLLHLVRPGDTLARIHGDEFVLLIEDVGDRSNAERTADRMRRAFAAPFTVLGRELLISASVGVSFAESGETVSERLLTEADLAMYDAKRDGDRALALKDRVMQDGQVSPAAELADALDREALRMVYQPIVRPQDGTLTGVEALLRWTTDDGSNIPPPAIVATAERAGLIVRLGAWVLDRSCRQAVEWQLRHPGDALELAVNVSTYQLMAPDFVASVRQALDRTGMPAGDLVLEVTENVLIDDSERARAVLSGIQDLGVRVALDDFGTGYSSLSYLQQLPIDILKIDRSFLGAGGRSDAIVLAVTELAHALDLTVVIEGVETPEQRITAVEVGADLAQGFLFARPMGPRQIEETLGVPGPRPPVRLPQTLPRPAASA